MDADPLFARYSAQAPFDDALIDDLLAAILNPESTALRKVIEAEPGARAFYRTAEFRALCAEGHADDEALFRTEALERAVLCNTIGDRLNGPSERFTATRHLLERFRGACQTYRPLAITREWPTIERIVRAHVHASETIGASNSMQSLHQFYDPVPMMEQAPAPDEGILARLAFQKERLETAERVTRESQRQAAYFKPRDILLLRKLAAVTGEVSATLARIDEERVVIAAERRRLVQSVSPEWRDLLDALFEAKHPTRDSGREAEEQAVLDLPQYAPLAAASPETRGRVVFEATAMHHSISEMRTHKVELRPGLRIGSDFGDIGHPVACGVLGGLATLLLQSPVVCDDATMAALIDFAIEWRPLCQTSLLDSAALTLAAGAAPRTEEALRRLAKRPSHCFVPSRNHGDYEGDAWWQDTPGRVARMLAERPPPRGRGFFGGLPFGRREERRRR